MVGDVLMWYCGRIIGPMNSFYTNWWNAWHNFKVALLLLPYKCIYMWNCAKAKTNRLSNCYIRGKTMKTMKRETTIVDESTKSETLHYFYRTQKLLPFCYKRNRLFSEEDWVCVCICELCLAGRQKINNFSSYSFSFIHSFHLCICVWCRCWLCIVVVVDVCFFIFTMFKIINIPLIQGIQILLIEIHGRHSRLNAWWNFCSTNHSVIKSQHSFTDCALRIAALHKSVPYEYFLRWLFFFFSLVNLFRWLILMYRFPMHLYCTHHFPLKRYINIWMDICNKCETIYFAFTTTPSPIAQMLTQNLVTTWVLNVFCSYYTQF